MKGNALREAFLRQCLPYCSLSMIYTLSPKRMATAYNMTVRKVQP